MVMVVGSDVGSTPLRFGEDVIVVPVENDVRALRSFDVASGLTVLRVTVGEKLGGFDGRVFVVAVYLSNQPGSRPLVASLPTLLNAVTVDQFNTPDQEDSPAATYPGNGSASGGAGAGERGLGRDAGSGKKGGDRRLRDDAMQSPPLSTPRRPAPANGGMRRLR
jgi:hypothetical protein